MSPTNLVFEERLLSRKTLDTSYMMHSNLNIEYSSTFFATSHASHLYVDLVMFPVPETMATGREQHHGNPRNAEISRGIAHVPKSFGKLGLAMLCEVHPAFPRDRQAARGD